MASFRKSRENRQASMADVFSVNCHCGHAKKSHQAERLHACNECSCTSYLPMGESPRGFYHAEPSLKLGRY
jgi:hypothetical protein